MVSKGRVALLHLDDTAACMYAFLFQKADWPEASALPRRIASCV